MRSATVVTGPGARVVAYFHWIKERANLVSLVIVRDNAATRQSFPLEKKKT